MARVAQEQGAHVLLTSFGKAMGLTEKSARRLPDPPDVLEMDANEPEHVERVRFPMDDRLNADDARIRSDVANDVGGIPKRLRLRQTLLIHQDALCPVDQLARLKFFF